MGQLHVVFFFRRIAVLAHPNEPSSAVSSQLLTGGLTLARNGLGANKQVLPRLLLGRERPWLLISCQQLSL